MSTLHGGLWQYPINLAHAQNSVYQAFFPPLLDTWLEGHMLRDRMEGGGGKYYFTTTSNMTVHVHNYNIMGVLKNVTFNDNHLKEQRTILLDEIPTVAKAPLTSEIKYCFIGCYLKLYILY